MNEIILSCQLKNISSFGSRVNFWFQSTNQSGQSSGGGKGGDIPRGDSHINRTGMLVVPFRG